LDLPFEKDMVAVLISIFVSSQNNWSEHVKELTRGFAPGDVWNKDETGAFWKALPTTSHPEKGKRWQGGKNA